MSLREAKSSDKDTETEAISNFNFDTYFQAKLIDR